jgi:3-methyladenine DNA glycosylase/8-oxoguanine DNA glycosylase
LRTQRGRYVAHVARRAVVEGSAALVRQAPEFGPLVDALGPADLRRGRPKRSHFAELVRAICYQQLAGPAASTIHGRLVVALDDDVTPEAVVAAPLERLRAAGLSANKAASIVDLAEKVLAGDVELDRVTRLSDDEIVRELTLVRGIGRWTAEMFLMFQLGRLDVWPVGDLGVRKGYAVIQGLAEMPSAKDLEALGDRFRPYRSLAAWYCWRAVDTQF